MRSRFFGQSHVREMRHLFSSLATVACVALIAAGCGQQPLPNVLVVTFDTTRYDHLGATGDPEARTPVVDALAARGILFERAYANVPITLPSHTTIFTGLEPREHGVHNNGRFRVPEEVETLAEMLKRSGYDTAAMVSAFVLDGRYNLDQGFDIYSDEVDPKSDPFSMLVPQRAGRATTDASLEWLESRSGEAPYLLWTHYYDPHHPRDVEPPFDEMPDGYRAEIAYTDEQFGRLLAGAEAADDGRGTLIVFTSDHGESLGEHGEETHAILAYDSTLHVPLILAGPGIPEGVRTRGFARHFDLVPTILTFLGLPVAENLGGRDLLADLSDQPEGESGFEFVSGFECRESEFALGWMPIEGVRTERWKYTARPNPIELYDINTDPKERRNLAAEHPDVVTRMAELYDALPSDVSSSDDDRIEVDPEEAAKLAALGYVEAPTNFAEGQRPDPRRFVTSQNWISTARGMASQGLHDQAIDILETLAESRSMQSMALRTLAPIYEQVGRADDGVAALRIYLELTDSPEARFSLAKMLLAADRAEETLQELDRTELDSPVVGRLRAHALATLGRHAEARTALDDEFAASDRERLRQRARLVVEARVAPDAESELRGLLAQAPDDLVIRSTLALRLAVVGGGENANEVLDLLDSLEEDAPESPDVLANMGWAYHRIDQFAQAAASLEAALEIAPSRLLDRVRLGVTLAELGEPDRAIEELNSALLIQPGAPWAGEARAQVLKLEAQSINADPEGVTS
jgi:arylsulfatase A-like enzyme